MDLEKFIETGDIDLLKRELGFSRIEDCFAELCRQNNIQAIEKLLEKEGRYLMSINKNQIIETIVTYSNLETIRYFIEIKEYDKYLRIKENLLEIASLYNSLDVVKYFIEERKIPLKNIERSLLERAVCKNDNLEMLKYLVEDCKINFTTQNYVSSLAEAIKRKNLQAIDYICDKRQDIFLTTDMIMLSSLCFDSVESLTHIEEKYGFKGAPKDLCEFFYIIIDNNAQNVFDFFYKKYRYTMDFFMIERLIYRAINKDNVYFVNYLLKKEHNLISVSLYVDKFLNSAINNGKVNIIEYFLKKYLTMEKYHLIAQKLVKGPIFIDEKIKLMEYLLFKSPECSKNEDTVYTLLSYLAKFGKMNKLKKIVENFNLDPTIKQNKILADTAETSEQNIEVMKYLVEKGCKFKFTTEPFVKNYENAFFMISNGYWQTDFDNLISIEKIKRAKDYIEDESFLTTIFFNTKQTIIKEWVKERLENKEFKTTNNFIKEI